MERIPVVDDEEKIRTIIRKYGEFEGYEIVEADQGYTGDHAICPRGRI